MKNFKIWVLLLSTLSLNSCDVRMSYKNSEPSPSDEKLENLSPISTNSTDSLTYIESAQSKENKIEMFKNLSLSNYLEENGSREREFISYKKIFATPILKTFNLNITPSYQCQYQLQGVVVEEKIKSVSDNGVIVKQITTKPLTQYLTFMPSEDTVTFDYQSLCEMNLENLNVVEEKTINISEHLEKQFKQFTELFNTLDNACRNNIVAGIERCENYYLDIVKNIAELPNGSTVDSYRIEMELIGESEKQGLTWELTNSFSPFELNLTYNLKSKLKLKEQANYFFQESELTIVNYFTPERKVPTQSVQ